MNKGKNQIYESPTTDVIIVESEPLMVVSLRGTKSSTFDADWNSGEQVDASRTGQQTDENHSNDGNGDSFFGY